MDVPILDLGNIAYSHCLLTLSHCLTLLYSTLVGRLFSYPGGIQVGYQMFNVMFSSLPIILYGLWEQDVSANISMENPELYKSGPQVLCSLAVLSLCSLCLRSHSHSNLTFALLHSMVTPSFALTPRSLSLCLLSHSAHCPLLTVLCSLSLCSLSLCFQDILFNSRTFSRWVLNAFWHSAVLSLLPTFITSQLVQEEGDVLEGTWVLGDSVFTCVVFVINAKLMLEVCCSIGVVQVA